MTDLQKVLLEMIKEIDVICQANGIEYYLSGGSVIGAIRHKGFIPWDDDIDILMTRKNWDKFYQVAQEMMPPNRKLECLESNSQFNNSINRYINTQTLNIHKNELLGDSNAGIVIDIFLLDEISDEKKSYQRYIKNVVLYSDLINDAYMYSLRWQFKMPYRLYLLQMKIFGRKYVLEKLKNRLISFSGNECSKYIVAWGGGPTLFDKTVFGTPRYVQFEDTFLPVPEKAYEFASILYGYDWINIPKMTEKSTHDTILSFNYSYEEWLQRMNWGEKETEIRTVYRRHKLLAVQWAARQNRDSYHSTLLDAYREKLVLENKIKDENIRVETLFKEHKYETLRELFSRYIDKQCSKLYVGGEIWEGLVRRHNPVFIDISDELLYYVLRLLLYDGELTKASRILRAREDGKNLLLPSQLEDIKKAISNICECAGFCERKEYVEATECLNRLSEEDQSLGIVSKLKIRIWKYGPQDHEQELSELVLKESQRFPEDGEFIKYYADFVRQSEGIGGACYLYKRAFENTRNGIIWNEIFQILLEEIEWLYEEVIKEITEKNQFRVEEMLDIWGIIPNILQNNLIYQKLYFQYQLSICNSEKELREIDKTICSLWDATEDRTILLETYAQVMKKMGIGTEFLQERIILTKHSEFQELEQLYDEMSRIKSETAEVRFLKAAVAYRIGKVGEAFEEYRYLWKNNEYIDSVKAILARDLLKQLQRMNGRKNRDAEEYFIKEWLIKYPDTRETVDILVGTGLCCTDNRQLIEEFVENMLNHDHYFHNVQKINRILYRTRETQELQLIN